MQRSQARYSLSQAIRLFLGKNWSLDPKKRNFYTDDNRKELNISYCIYKNVGSWKMDKRRYFIIGSFVILVSFIFIIAACSQLLANSNINFLNSNSKASEGFNTFADVMKNGINYINNKDNNNGMSPYDPASVESFVRQMNIRTQQMLDQQLKDAIRQAEQQRQIEQFNRNQMLHHYP
ncbi:MAG: hypothetical protein NTW30_04360 [Candidatus Aenigmarchaeota archaeon]|nr:hypothetical protein [Candidatus Aenigmarchaeota archaeon]